MTVLARRYLEDNLGLRDRLRDPGTFAPASPSKDREEIR
jgi:hypothetical protein